jgi:arylsulfatase A-like enzyme
LPKTRLRSFGVLARAGQEDTAPAVGVAPGPGYPHGGVDLLPVLTGRAAEFERPLYWRMRHRYQRAVRRGGWKYLKVADHEYLFDIEYDSSERGDLSKNSAICSSN